MAFVLQSPTLAPALKHYSASPAVFGGTGRISFLQRCSAQLQGKRLPAAALLTVTLQSVSHVRRRSSRSCCCQAFRQKETEAERLRLDREARAGRRDELSRCLSMEEYMVRIEKLAEEGNVRAQKTAWKWKIRKKVWNYLEDNNIADFPRPVHHRIPNFKGSKQAGERLATLPEFMNAKVVKINPDTPQKSVRVATLEAQKTLYVPQPRLRTGFFSRILPGEVPPERYNFAATARGMKELANPLGLDDRTKIDVVVIGSSAVNPVNGARIGKGEGFAELEYGMMRELGMIDENTPVITTIHDSQVISEDFPPKGKGMMVHDVPVDIIVTPTQIIRVPEETRLPKPTGIYWDILSKQKIAEIKVLRSLKALLEKESGKTLELAEQEEALPPLAQRGQRGQKKMPPLPGRPESPSETQNSPPQQDKPAGIKAKLTRRSKASDA